MKIDLKEEGINCNADFLDYLQENVKLLNLYYSFVKTPWPQYFKNNLWTPFQYTVHRVETNYCDGREDISFLEEHYDLNYKIYGERKFYFDICPFHLNHHETYCFYIDEPKNLYYCLGCDNGGSNFEFIMNLYNLNLLEATRVLGTVSLWTSMESENNLFFQEQMRLLHAPTCLSPTEWAVVFHLTRRWNYDFLIAKADKKRRNLFERIDRYIIHQYQIGRLPIKKKNEEHAILKDSIKENSMMDEIYQKMANRLCVEKKLLKQRIDEYEKK